MRTLSIITLVILSTSLQSFAQEKTNGFYINPNLNVSKQFSSFGDESPVLHPQLLVGYLNGNKNRHNVAFYYLNGGLSKGYQNIGFGLRYNYDVMLYKYKHLHFYISPFVKVYSQLSHYKQHQGNTTLQNAERGLFIESGISPSLEYSLTKKLDFVMSTPINFFNYSYYTNSHNDGNTKSSESNSYFRYRPSLEMNVGLRIHLFNKN